MQLQTDSGTCLQCVDCYNSLFLSDCQLHLNPRVNSQKNPRLQSEKASWWVGSAPWPGQGGAVFRSMSNVFCCCGCNATYKYNTVPLSVLKSVLLNHNFPKPVLNGLSRKFDPKKAVYSDWLHMTLCPSSLPFPQPVLYLALLTTSTILEKENSSGEGVCERVSGSWLEVHATLSCIYISGEQHLQKSGSAAPLA